MKYKGIIFSAPMVRANRASLKTQTRRIMKPQPPACYEQLSSGPFFPTKVDRHGEEYPGEEIFGAFSEDGEFGIKAPMQPGDVCYVKETWQCCTGCYGSPGYIYKADYRFLPAHKWKSPMYMPMVAARDWIRIENVRAERVQDITEEDARAEGFNERGEASAYFMSSYGLEAFVRNPWVWAYTYSRCEKPEDA